MASLAVVPSPAKTAAPLYAIEEHLAALVETAELVPEEQEKEFAAELQKTLIAAIDKRDRVGQFMAHLERQIAFAKEEIDRLRARKAMYERALDRIEGYVKMTIFSLGTDSDDKYRKLEGKTVTFSLRASPPSVEIINEENVPAGYKTLTIQVPAGLWEQALDAMEIDQRSALLDGVKSSEVSIDKRSIKKDIDRGIEVSGADLAIGNYNLRRS